MIEVATKEDLPEMMELMKQFHKESAFARYAPNIQKTHAWLENQMDHGVIFCSRKAGKIDGFIGVTMRSHHMVDVTYGSEGPFYVDTSQRQGFKAVRLIKAAQAWTREMGGEYFQINATAGIQLDNIGKLCAALGGVQIGAIWSFDNV